MPALPAAMPAHHPGSSILPAYLPVTIPTRTPMVAQQQRVAISPRSHARLSRLAAKRFRGTGSISKLGAVVLDQYLAHLERAYFGRSRTSACIPIPRQQRDMDAVLFDMDGVLCDSEMASRHAAVAMFDRYYGVSVRAEDFAPFTGTGEATFLSGVAALYKVGGFDADEAKQRFFSVYTSGGYTQGLQAFPGVVGLVKRVRALGLKVAVASSADAVKVRANLHAIGLPVTAFDFVTCGDDIKRKKPAPDVFLAAANGLGVLAERCVVIEDAEAGVVAARRAGMRCVAVSTSMGKGGLERAGAHLVRSEPAMIQIPDLFGRVVYEEDTGGKGEGGMDITMQMDTDMQMQMQVEEGWGWE